MLLFDDFILFPWTAKKNVILKMHGSIEFPVKEVHFARSNLNALNLIGRGTAGKHLK